MFFVILEKTLCKIIKSSVILFGKCRNRLKTLWKNARAMLRRKISTIIEHFYEVNRAALLLTGVRQISKRGLMSMMFMR